MSESTKWFLYLTLSILNAGLTAFAVELGKGTVPLPKEWAFVGPVLIACITAAGALLPKVGRGE